MHQCHLLYNYWWKCRDIIWRIYFRLLHIHATTTLHFTTVFNVFFILGVNGCVLHTALFEIICREAIRTIWVKTFRLIILSFFLIVPVQNHHVCITSVYFQLYWFWNTVVIMFFMLQQYLCRFQKKKSSLISLVSKPQNDKVKTKSCTDKHRYSAPFAQCNLYSSCHKLCTPGFQVVALPDPLKTVCGQPFQWVHAWHLFGFLFFIQIWINPVRSPSLNC